LSFIFIFFSGLVASHTFVEYAMVKVSEDYLSEAWGKEELVKATVLINLQDGITAVSTVIVAHFADCCVGRFNMIVICTLSYITVSLCSVLV
jgi:hypothetical protein